MVVGFYAKKNIDPYDNNNYLIQLFLSKLQQ